MICEHASLYAGEDDDGYPVRRLEDLSEDDFEGASGSDDENADRGAIWGFAQGRKRPLAGDSDESDGDDERIREELDQQLKWVMQAANLWDAYVKCSVIEIVCFTCHQTNGRQIACRVTKVEA